MICSHLQLFFVCAKTISSVFIIILIVTPTKIYREEITSKLEEGNFTYIRHHVRHFVCPMPHGDNIESITGNELLEALELPVGTVVGRRLTIFARCRAERMKSGKDMDDCVCCERPAFFLLLVVAFCSTLLDFLRFWLPTVFKRFQNNNYSGMFDFLVISCSSTAWFIIGIAASVTHSNWNDEVWLLNKLYSQNYFYKPPSWSLALALAFICSICGFLELLYLRKRVLAKKEDQKTVEEHKEHKISPDDDTKIVDVSDTKECTLKVRKFQKRMTRSWP